MHDNMLMLSACNETDANGTFSIGSVVTLRDSLDSRLMVRQFGGTFETAFIFGETLRCNNSIDASVTTQACFLYTGLGPAMLVNYRFQSGTERTVDRVPLLLVSLGTEADSKLTSDCSGNSDSHRCLRGIPLELYKSRLIGRTEMSARRH